MDNCAHAHLLLQSNAFKRFPKSRQTSYGFCVHPTLHPACKFTNLAKSASAAIQSLEILCRCAVVVRRGKWAKYWCSQFLRSHQLWKSCGHNVRYTSLMWRCTQGAKETSTGGRILWHDLFSCCTCVIDVRGHKVYHSRN